VTARRAIPLAGALALLLAASAGATRPPVPEGPAAATVDLGTSEGAALVRGAWRYSDARVVEREHRAPDADGQPTGAPLRTWDVAPRAGRADFDDAAWEAIAPESLSRRRSTGRLCFNWYRIRIVVPERIGSFDPAGSTVVFETVLDDYAEIWVDGELSRGLGQRGGSVVAGWNAPNRVVIARGVKPGREIQLAIFGANGPLSDPPANFIWVRRAALEFFPGGPVGPYALAPEEVNVEIERKHPGLDAIVPANPKIFKLAEGFEFIEGPLWLRERGRLLFSDPNANRIYEYDPAGPGSLRVFREQSGYDGADVAEYGQPGSNGLSLDREGRLTVAEHGRHRISRLAGEGAAPEVLADRFEGKRLNSPNDLVWRSDGTLYFSDPPFGLPRFYDDPRRELPFSGVFAWQGGALRLVSRDLLGPNGLAFSPDERFLYVGNWDPQRKVVMRYEVGRDGSLANGRVFFDMTGAPGTEALDGLKVDEQGNLYVSGPGGIWVLSPGAEHLGTIRAPRLAANFAWGDADGRTLYLTARSTLYRMPLRVAGIRP
jgi:gluconolactonase